MPQEKRHVYMEAFNGGCHKRCLSFMDAYLDFFVSVCVDV